MCPKKSDVWRFFIKESASAVRCKVCKHVLKYCGNTTNLINHIKYKHKDQELVMPCNSTPKKSSTARIEDSMYDICCIEHGKVNTESPSSENSSVASCSTRQLSIDEAFGHVNSYSIGGSRDEEITNSIVYMIAKDCLPLSTVNKVGFITLLKTIVPLYKPPSRATITTRIDRKYATCSLKVKEYFKNINFFTITADIWTEIKTTMSYLGVTVHYLDSTPKLISRIIGVIPLTESHTSDYIETEIKKIFIDWNITLSKVVCLVTDNGQNIVKAASQLVGKQKHLPCFAHTLNLVPSKAIEQTEGLPALIYKVKEIVTFFKHSVNAADELRRLQDKGSGEVLKLIQSVPTRWNSTYYMLERFVLLYEVVGAALLKFPRSPTMLNAEELDVIRELIQLLKPLEQVTVELSGSNYVTASMVIPLIRCMVITLNKYYPKSNLMICLKRNLLTEIDKRFKNVEKVTILALATLLDPRFKKIHFCDPVALTTGISTLIKQLNEMEDGNACDEISVSLTSNTNTGEEMNLKPTLWSFHDELVTTMSKEEPKEQGINVKQFLNQPVINRHENPLQYWNRQKSAYPSLYNLATKYLSIVATSVPSERLFSKAGVHITQSRNRITPKRLSSLLFLNSLSAEEWHL